MSQKVFLAQFDTIKKIAKEEKSCVIIGRCADCALHDFDNVINVFFHASEDFRIARAAAYPDVPDDIRKDREKLREFILRKDKQRQSYYNYYAMKKWGNADTYDISINTELMGISGTVRLMSHLIDDFEAMSRVSRHDNVEDA